MPEHTAAPTPGPTTDPAAGPSGLAADLGLAAQRAAEEHLVAVWEAEAVLEEDPDADVDSPAVGPWDGCDTCQVRETLAAAWPVLLEGIRAELTANGFRGAADHLGEAYPAR